MAAKTATEATDAALVYEWQAATGTYAWRKEHAWRLDKIAQILTRTDAGKHFPPADAAGYACRAWPVDGECQGWIGLTPPGLGMDREDRTSTVDIHFHDNLVASKAGSRRRRG